MPQRSRSGAQRGVTCAVLYRKPPPTQRDKAASDFRSSFLELCWANWPAMERSDAAGQFVGKRAGSARVGAKGGAKRRP
jgi:hypothetical protein